ncbi:MAG: SoxR reducing system RseC family protein [Nitrospirota bacterium]|nr:SoxR reducing system RseC family protein [Nitrospirota bacterium]
MIEDIGKVVKISGDKAFVEVERSSACAQCGLQEVEELAAGGKPIFEALNMTKANIGDKVKVRVESAAYMKVSAFIYGIPVLLLIMGAVLGVYLAGKFNKSTDIMSALFGMCGLIAGIIILFLFRKKGAKKEYIPVIVEVIK